MSNFGRLWITSFPVWLLLLILNPTALLAATINFEGFPDSTILNTQYSGLTFSNAIILTVGISLNEFEFPPHSGTNIASDNGGPMIITFSPPVQSFSGFFTYRVALTLRAFDSSNNQVAAVVSHFSNNEALSGSPGSSPNELLQVSFAAGISKVTITGDPTGGSFALDDATSQTGAVQPPSPVSVSPASGSALSQTFAFAFTDPRGAQDLGVLNVLVNNALDGRHACYLAYSQPLNVLYLVGDDGGSLSPGSAMNASGSVANSQCSVSWGSNTLAISGNNLTLSLNIGFSGSFAGNKVVYSAARDVAENNSGWQPLGVWQVPGGAPATTTAVLGMSPARGSGLSQTTFTFDFSDTKGFLDLGVENILINNALDGRHACYLAYARSINVLYLVNDNGDALLPGQSLATSGALNNSQCTVGWGSNPVAATGNNLSLSLNIGFDSGFGPYLIFYLASRDMSETNNTGWQAMGTWTAQ